MNKLRLFFIKKIFNLFFSNGNHISLVDIGAEGGLEPRWRGVEKYIDYCGVEPDARSNNLLDKRRAEFNHYKIVPFALWSSSRKLVLNLCRQPSASSIFKPNQEFINKFPRADRFDVVQEVQIQAKILDEAFDGDVDFLKIDTQGAELEIIRGSVNHLEYAIGLEVEVQFHKIYCDEPLFNDVSSYLELHNFQFIDFIHLKRWGRYKLDNKGQLVFADALFLRTPEYILEKNSKELCERYIGICLLYSRFDYIKVILESTIGVNQISAVSKRYIKILESIYELIFFLTRGISNLQRRIHPNYRSHFLF